MASNIPTPRSYQSILGEMIDTFVSRVPIKGLKVGGPLLSILEAAARSDVRSSQDLFNLLDATSLDRASGLALDRKAADEGLKRRPATPATGQVAFIDTNFTKIATTVYAGGAAPNAGTTSINVADASQFPNSGQIYIGRGTVNYEGPISYTSVTNNSSYWTITIPTGTQRFHNSNETVILAQGGNRPIAAGQQVRTAQGNAISAVTFNTTSAATIVDGETEIDSVSVTCTQAGVIGNVPAGAVTDIVGAPFNGLTVTNPIGFNSALSSQDDKSLRDSIRNAIQSRSRGTALALTTFSLGATSPSENKTVVSAAVVSLQGEPTTLFVDDGTGYEEVDAGVATESLMDQAAGGEQYFSVGQTPVTKAFVQTTFSAPFALSNNSILAVKVGGVLNQHTFVSTSFRAISNATATEVAAAINANPNISFGARTANSGTAVVLFARSEFNEDIEVVSPSTGVDANATLGFPAGINYSLWLYKNDQLLTKDGVTASITSAPQPTWGTMSDGAQLKVQVDQTPAVTYTFNNSDFVNAGTGYASVSATNSLDSWAAVLNAKIPGITTSVSGATLVLASNLGANAKAAISLSGGLVTAGMFTQLSATGKNKDYTLNRNTGQLKLSSPLVAGDRLTAGTQYTRAYAQSASLLNGVTIAGSAGNVWVAVDGAANVLNTGITSLSTISITTPATNRVRFTIANNVFGTVGAPYIQRGDYVILWDSAILSNGVVSAAGVRRVSDLDTTNYSWFEIEQSLAPSPSSFSLVNSGLVFVRSNSPLQQISIGTGTGVNTSTIASNINAVLLGATASVYRNQYLRLTTNTFGSTGDIAVVSADLNGQKLLLPSGLFTNATNHMASVVSGNSETGTPTFSIGAVTAITDSTHVTVSGTISANNLLKWVRRLPYASAESHGANAGSYLTLQGASSGSLILGTATSNVLTGDRFWAATPYAINALDTLNLVLNQDSTNNSYVLKMGRKVKPAGSAVYSSSGFGILDADNQSLAPSAAFGSSNTNLFKDFALVMNARGKSHASVANKAVLWRYGRIGAEGNKATVEYVNPTAPSSGISWTNSNGQNAKIKIQLPSGAVRTGLNLGSSVYFYASLTTAGSTDTIRYTWANLAVATGGLVRASNVVTGTITTSSAITGHGFQVGDTVYVTCGDANFPSGAKTLTAVTATTFTYSEVGTATSSTSSATVAEASVAPALNNASVGDIVNISSSTQLPTAHWGSFRVTALASNYFEIVRNHGDVSAVTVPASSGPSNSIQFYPINTGLATVSSIVSWVNSNIPTIVTAVAVNCDAGGDSPGTGVITSSTQEEFLQGTNNASGPSSVANFTFSDGINYVAASNLGASPNTITLKNAVTSGLTTNNDFLNETMYLVPITASNIASYISNPGVSGLYSSSEIVTANDYGAVQISSSTIGGNGAIEVSGGSANAVAASIVGSASITDTSYCKVTVPSALGSEFSGGNWVALQAANTTPKISPWNSANTIQIAAGSDSTQWVLTFSGSPLISLVDAVNIASGDTTVRISKQGRFVAYTVTSNYALSGSISEGNWAAINLSNASSANNGTFAVVRFDAASNTFWVENPNGISESANVTLSTQSIKFYTYDSLLPGDSIVIDTTVSGTVNKGRFPIIASSTTTVTVQGTMLALAPTVLGTNAAYVRAIEAKPLRLIKQIHTIGTLPGNTAYTELVFNTNALAGKVTSAAGFSVQALDKLAFPTTTIVGADGYSYATGLIGEVNKIVYGDPSNATLYPGVAAAGTNINISGPFIKRVQVSLAVRVRNSTVTVRDIKKNIQNAVAALINATPQGQSISVDDITNAAKIPGVISVIPLSPALTIGTDLISVQINEKPRVENLDQDILVSVVGE